LSDRALRALRAPGESGYAIPRGGAFEWVSCPNYLGELLEWFGWAIATWSIAGLAFALYTAANLGPRALAHHAWYRERFPGYPPRRRALIPFVL
jgi:protein-S-isoprenylcysteine O-methyltransferase Ste14